MSPAPNLSERPEAFLFATCQVGAERALKAEIARDRPELHFAFSRPGFLTFRASANHADVRPLVAVFARSSGQVLGKVEANSLEKRVAAVWGLVGEERFDRLHVWQRDTAKPGYRGFEPSIGELARDVETALRSSPAAASIPSGPTEASHRVLDCVIVEPDLWWLGAHQALDAAGCWPGGIPPLAPPPELVSRAWLKMEESLAWPKLQVRRGQVCAEIGCAPGGASQALLGHGLKVIGIDPAEVDPRVMQDPNFTHWRKRGADVRRREFRHVRWLTADVNVAPAYTLEMVESIVTHESVSIDGLILTLKLLRWSLAAEVPKYLDRVRSWGYRQVRARQLAHNRQEICVVASGRAKKRQTKK